MKKRLTIIFITVLLLLATHGVLITNVNAAITGFTRQDSMPGSLIYIRNVQDGLFMYKSNGLKVCTHTDKTYKQYSKLFEWLLIPEGTGIYSIYWSHNVEEAPKLLKGVMNEEGNYIVQCVDEPETLTNSYKWEIYMNLDGEYIIKNVEYNRYMQSNENDSISLVYLNSITEKQKWTIGESLGDQYIGLESMKVVYSKWMEVSETQTLSVTETPYNAFFTMQTDYIYESGDTTVITISNNGIITAHKTGYTYFTIKHKSSGITQRYPIAVGQIIDDGDYYLSNRLTGGFCEIKDSSILDGTSICDADLDMLPKQKWSISYYGEGYYLIQSTVTDKYMGVEPYYYTTGAKINIYTYSDSILNRLLWRIIPTTQGSYCLIQKCNEVVDYALSSMGELRITGDFLNYVDQGVYSNDFNYEDEWYIESVSNNNVYSNGVGILYNNNYLLMNVCSQRYLKQGSEDDTDILGISTSETVNSKTNWYMKGLVASSGIYSLGSLIDSTYHYIYNNNSNLQLDTKLSSSVIVKRVNIKPYDGTYVLMIGNYYIAEDQTDYKIILTNELTTSCFWSLQKATNGSCIYMNAIGNDSSEVYNDVMIHYLNKGFTTYTYNDPTASQGYQYLKNPTTDVFIFRGHAGPGVMCYSQSELYAASIPESNQNGSDYSMYEYNNNELANVNIALFLGCSSGLETASDVGKISSLSIAYEKGVHFVIGTIDTVYTSNSNAFTSVVSDYLERNYSIYEAIQRAQEYFEINNITIALPNYGLRGHNYPVIYMGDTYQKLN